MADTTYPWLTPHDLGAVSQDDLRLDQALQHLSTAASLNPKNHLALKNRANVHMAYADELATAKAPSLLPPQHELALGLYAKSMEQDWWVHLYHT